MEKKEMWKACVGKLLGSYFIAAVNIVILKPSERIMKLIEAGKLAEKDAHEHEGIVWNCGCTTTVKAFLPREAVVRYAKGLDREGKPNPLNSGSCPVCFHFELEANRKPKEVVVSKDHATCVKGFSQMLQAVAKAG